MSAAGHSRARNIRFSVLIASDAATLILSDAQQTPASAARVPAGTLTAATPVTGPEGQQPDCPIGGS